MIVREGSYAKLMFNSISVSPDTTRVDYDVTVTAKGETEYLKFAYVQVRWIAFNQYFVDQLKVGRKTDAWDVSDPLGARGWLAFDVYVDMQDTIGGPWFRRWGGSLPNISVSDIQEQMPTPPPPPKVEIAVSAGKGTICADSSCTTSSITLTFSSGQTVTFKATPESQDYGFDHFELSGGVPVYANPFSMSVVGDSYVHVFFFYRGGPPPPPAPPPEAKGQIVEFTCPDTAKSGSTFPLLVTAKNIGNIDGHFKLSVYLDGVYYTGVEGDLSPSGTFMSKPTSANQFVTMIRGLTTFYIKMPSHDLLVEVKLTRMV